MTEINPLGDWILTKKQKIWHDSKATEMLVGGSAGPGKSFFMRYEAVYWALAIPGIQIYFYRRQFPDLMTNHMTGKGSLPDICKVLIAHEYCTVIRSGQPHIKFLNGDDGGWGSIIHLRHYSQDKDWDKVQGAEMHMLIIDELTQFPEQHYRNLRSRCRLGVFQSEIPARHRAMFPRIIGSANPGGIGHMWVKTQFVDAAPSGIIHRALSQEGGMLRVFHRAILKDNPHQDADYEDKLKGLGDEELVNALLAGDWSIAAGLMFSDVFTADDTLTPFKIPKTWIIWRSYDWGSSSPFSVGWWAKSDGCEVMLADGTTRSFKTGSMFRIHEWYGWKGKKPNKGLEMDDADIADGILEREAFLKDTLLSGQKIRAGPADRQIFDVRNSWSIAMEMAKAGVKFIPADKRPGSRISGWKIMRQMMAAARKFPMERPGLFCFSTCVDGFMRTIPNAPRDVNNRDDLDTDSEDHCCDESRYAVTTPVPVLKVGTLNAR